VAGKVRALEEAVDLVREGDLVGMTLPDDLNLGAQPMGFLRALVRRGPRRLRLVGITGGSINCDLLIGAGVVEQIETCHMRLGDFGTCPNFEGAVKAGTLKVLDNT
jgi:glutaconate CoA-transferase subunit A